MLYIAFIYSNNNGIPRRADDRCGGKNRAVEEEIKRCTDYKLRLQLRKKEELLHKKEELLRRKEEQLKFFCFKSVLAFLIGLSRL